ncbi:SH2 domain and PTB/PI domain and Pleckstrin homology-like domain-containing protein [Strongyloides ratti]|uniref:SH2 domain and PTB/PI domain and Pleckstrin homology-like domain-containing protein n=1 Tax=Strongyloides ratti TaxID=34506 RepID=A0A090LFG8_STRRB|nr:SH2 domain and PTB/PI domain and Pleckstrin homology-like domain-containing protein [Strongyloides ratti]CEF68512.1 SH2 domain and PTB/PI domain and Pleckstrin homology-like domain-containing protein [Strongyloides ratti]
MAFQYQATVQYRCVLVGIIEVDHPIGGLTESVQRDVVSKCIELVAYEANLLQTNNNFSNDIREKYIGIHNNPLLMKIDVDMNITNNSFTITRVNPGPNEKPGVSYNNWIDISIAFNGDDVLSDFFAYIAKKKGHRRCFVFHCEHGQPPQMMKAIRDIYHNFRENKKHVVNNMFKQPIAPPVPPRKRNFPKETNPLLSNLETYPWYHGHKTREEATALLKIPGDFLLRTSRGGYVLSVVCSDETVGNFIFEKDVKIYKVNGIEYDSLIHLIEYFMRTKENIHLGKHAEVRLVNPIKRDSSSPIV